MDVDKDEIGSRGKVVKASPLPLFLGAGVVGTALAPLPHFGWNMRFNREVVDDLQGGPERVPRM